MLRDPRIEQLAAVTRIPVHVLEDAVEAGRAAVRASRRPATETARYVELPPAILAAVRVAA